MKKPLLASALAIALVTTSGCAAIMRFIGDMTANAITQKTGNLSDLAVRVNYTTNLFPKDSGLIETESPAWEDGQNLLQVVLLKRQGVGLYELDGAVGYQAKPNGPILPLTYVGKGAYQLALPAKDQAPKTIVLRAANGQTATLKVAPAKPITIKAINGKAPKHAPIDLGRDLVLDLANPPGAGTTLKVSIAAQAMGLKTMTAIGHFKAADHLVIPKEAFRNMVLSASQDVGLVGIEKGPSYLVVERYDASYPGGGVGAAEVLGQAWSWAPVQVTGDAPLNTQLMAKGKLPGSTSEIGYFAFKPNAFYGPPLSQAHRIGLGTLRARGKLYEAKSFTSVKEGFDVRVTTTTTIIKRFPEVPEGHWQALLADLDAKLTEALKRTAGATLLPPDSLAGSPTYKAMRELQDIVDRGDTLKDGEVTKAVTKVLPGSRQVLPESLESIEVSSTFPADRAMSRILRETKLDGLLAATLDLQIATDQKTGQLLVLIPRLTWVLYGPANGYSAFPVAYGHGAAETSDGMPFNAEALQRDPAEMSRVARLDELVSAFEASLRDLRGKEQAAGYEAIWKLH